MLRETRTENGLVRGLPAADPRITAFKGIPFAAPPVGDLRWCEPKPAANWDGVRPCYEFGPIPMQSPPGTGSTSANTKEWHVDPDLPISEDCLYLNVWTPAKKPGEKLPVMIWLFGGALQHGYTDEMQFDGERIARRGVVLVSVSYRVNVFGFFSHAELTAENPDSVHGNWGFLDQKAGIDWVRCNIVNFGGDPDNITIFGQSAGGRSVFVHMTSPMAAGSFQKAIAQSCGAMRVYAPKGLERPYQTLAQAEETGRAFFEFIGANSLNEARALSADTIFEKHLAFNKSHLSPMGNFGLIIDGKYVTEDPTDTFLAGNYPQIPLIMGLTADEFTAGPEFGDQASIKKWALDNFGDLADDFLALCREKAGDDPQKMKEAATIRLFDISVRQCLDLSAERGHRDIYYYLFGPEIPGDDAGAFHSSDLWFEFETLAKCWRPFTGKHYDLARQMCNYWTNFAKKGNPNGLDHDGTAMPEWTPYSLESPRAMAFMDSPSMQMENPDKLTDFLVRHNRALNQK